MICKTIHGGDRLPLAKATRGELVTAWLRAFRQKAPAQTPAQQLRDMIVAATSPLWLDFEVNRQRGFAIEG